MDKLKY